MPQHPTRSRQCHERVGADRDERREDHGRDRQPCIERVRRATRSADDHAKARTTAVIKGTLSPGAGPSSAISASTPIAEGHEQEASGEGTGLATVHGHTSGLEPGVGLRDGPGARRLDAGWPRDVAQRAVTVVQRRNRGSTSGVRTVPRATTRPSRASRRSRNASEPVIDPSERSCLLVTLLAIVACRRRGEPKAVARSGMRSRHRDEFGGGQAAPAASAAPSAAPAPDDGRQPRRRRQDRPHRHDRAPGHATSRRRSSRPVTASARMGGYVGASQTAERRRPPGRDDHLSGPGRPLGGRARSAPGHRRPDRRRS